MTRKPIVYVNKIDNLSDARYCAGMGVDYLGISIEPESIDYVSPEKFKEIERWVSGPKWVIQTNHYLANLGLGVEIKKYSSASAIHIKNNIYESIEPSINCIVEMSFNDWIENEIDLNKIHPNLLFVVLNNLPNYDYLVHSLKSSLHTNPCLLKLEKHQNIWAQTLIIDTDVAGFMVHGEKEIETGLKNYDYLNNILE